MNVSLDKSIDRINNPETTVRLHPLGLYDRVICTDNYQTKYICIDENLSINPCDTIDTNATIIFEKSINPQVDPRTYVCIKVGNKQREQLVI